MILKEEKAVFAAGCFWGVEEIFAHTKGVINTVVGYTGGTLENPTYEKVCGGNTGHAEAVEVTYDPQQVSYESLLRVFWESHDPTTWHRQGPDIGAQYRSAIFYSTPEQKKLAEESKVRLQKEYDAIGRGNIVTEIVPVQTFWRAEEYHQKYFEKNGGGVCHI